MNIESWFNDPAKVSAYAILLALVVSFVKGWIVPSITHNRVLEEKDKLEKERDNLLAMLVRSNDLTQRASLSSVEVTKIAREEIAKANTK